MRYLLSLLFLCAAGVALAQGYAPPPPGGSIGIRTPDGGVPVTWSGAPTVQIGLPDGGVQSLQAEVTNRIQADVSTPEGSYLAVAGDRVGARLEVAVPAGVTATISGTPSVTVSGVPTVALENGTIVNLGSASLSALTAASSGGQCLYTSSTALTVLGNTAINVPSSPLSGRTAVTVKNTSTNANKRVQCVPGGTATAAIGNPIYSGGSYWKWEGAQAGWVLSCICVDNGNASTGCTYYVEEEKCYQP